MSGTIFSVAPPVVFVVALYESSVTYAPAVKKSAPTADTFVPVARPVLAASPVPSYADRRGVDEDEVQPIFAATRLPEAALPFTFVPLTTGVAVAPVATELNADPAGAEITFAPTVIVS